MASILPFRGLRPARDVAAAVSSVPYDVVSTEEARALAENNPLSFLHVTRAEIGLPPQTDPYSPRVYEKARENFTRLRERAPLVLEETPSLYIYRLQADNHEQTGIAGCFSVDEYESDVVRKHERTRRDKEDDRTRHMVEVGAQTGVVFLTYRRSTTIDGIATRATAGEPLYDFVATDGVRHTIWRAGPEEGQRVIEAFAPIPAIYIADGHHRAASAARARAELRAKSPEAAAFIAVAFPDNQIRIQPYNRTVKDLGDRTSEQFLDAVRVRFAVTDGVATPRRRGEVSMYVAGRWYAIDIGHAEPEAASRAGTLDVALLQRHVLEGLLKINDIRTDTRIEFVGGTRGTAALEDAVNSGKAAVAFSMFPVTVDDLMAISDTGGIMPPKSTWFEPKLRDGLLIHLL